MLKFWVRILFSLNFANAKFRGNKTLRNGEITQLFTDVGKSCTSQKILTLLIGLLT